MEAEAELRDRTRAYQLRWVEMEAEISALKNNKLDLMNRITGLPAAQEQAQIERGKVDTLLTRIRDLETITATISPLKKMR